VSVLTTQPNESVLRDHTGPSSNKMKTPDPDLLMALKLDALGWTKVFIDVRDRIPLPSIPMPSFITGRSDVRKEFEDFIYNQMVQGAASNSYSDSPTAITVQSKDLARILASSEKLTFPLGHTVMVANSKSEFYARLNAKGRPVMDKLALDLITDVLHFNNL